MIASPIALAENTIGRQPMNGGNGNGFTVGGPMYTLNATGVHGVADAMAVRRLTPTECERLQGFPDGYTDIQPNGKQTPDGPRYKALGNSMAVPVMKWIGERIGTAEKARAKALEQQAVEV
jgi:DNA (cytosine-5)-methyltransferase 1